MKSYYMLVGQNKEITTSLSRFAIFLTKTKQTKYIDALLKIKFF